MYIAFTGMWAGAVDCGQGKQACKHTIQGYADILRFRPALREEDIEKSVSEVSNSWELLVRTSDDWLQVCAASCPSFYLHFHHRASSDHVTSIGQRQKPEAVKLNWNWSIKSLHAAAPESHRLLSQTTRTCPSIVIWLHSPLCSSALSPLMLCDLTGALHESVGSTVHRVS